MYRPLGSKTLRPTKPATLRIYEFELIENMKNKRNWLKGMGEKISSLDEIQRWSSNLISAKEYVEYCEEKLKVALDNHEK